MMNGELKNDGDVSAHMVSKQANTGHHSLLRDTTWSDASMAPDIPGV